MGPDYVSRCEVLTARPPFTVPIRQRETSTAFAATLPTLQSIATQRQSNYSGMSGLTQPRQKGSPRRKCARCGEPSSLLLRKTFATCTACAQKSVENKAKGILEHARGAALLDRLGNLDTLDDGRRQSVRQGKERERGGVAVAFSGGASSR